MLRFPDHKEAWGCHGEARPNRTRKGTRLPAAAARRPLGGWEPAPFELVLSTLRMTLFRDPNALFPLDQVGSNDLTLVNLHLAALSLPGGESASKNHGDSHRLASFAHTLQETLKGRTWSFPASAGSPAPAGEWGGGLFQAPSGPRGRLAVNSNAW